MVRTSHSFKSAFAVGLFAAVIFLVPASASAHCDTYDGPVIIEAKQALEKGNVAPVLKWVKKENAAKITEAFKRTMAVRSKGPEAKELADNYFFETLVRIHRAGEGAPYTGLKDEPVEPIVAMADKALAEGSADDMVKEISGDMAVAIKEKFSKALEAKKNKDKSEEAGREFVEAYVIYVHYVEGIHGTVMPAGGHQHTKSAVTPSGHEQHK